MREVFLKNKEVLDRLNGFIKTIEGLDMSELDIKEIGDKDKVYATSKKYLQLMLNKVEQKKFKGPPEIIKGIDISHIRGSPLIGPWRDLANDVGINFAQELGVQQNALFCYYPEDGYIGWHDNRDAPGYTILFNWSKGGDAFYRYRDWKTGLVHTIHDRPGWTCKTGWYGPGDKSTFHCALTNEPRWSIAFYARNETMRDEIIDQLEEE
jgi:hypothetical protein|tara:strand:+ start:537 stop:1163 length:627 start_codon:yes stop_codon:yes gene_type:complete